MKLCTLQEFIAKEGYRIDSHSCICEFSHGEKIKLTKNHINITNIWLEEYNANGVILAVDYKSPDWRISDSVNIHRAYTGQRISCKWEELYRVLEPDIKKGHLTKILKLYKKYFCYCVNEYIAQNPVALSDCGWLREGGETFFLSLNHSYSKPKEIEGDFFNGMKQADVFKQELSANSSFCNFFDFILSDENILTIFSYSVHAILWNYIHGYKNARFDETSLNSDTDLFSLCIYGDNPGLSKAVANLLSNVFTLKQNVWTVIQRKYHVSATSLSDKRFNQLPKYRCVPIIITSKDDHLTKASKIIKQIQRQRKNGRLHIFPVYINKTPIRADEMVNCCTNSLIGSISLTERDWLHTIHLCFCVLLYHFVQFLTTISRYDDNVSNQVETRYQQNAPYEILEQETLSDEWLDTHTPEFLLYVTMYCFCRFLEKTPLIDFSKVLCEACRACFLPHPDNKPIQSKAPIIEDTILQDFRTFIHESIKLEKNHSWIFDGEEARGKEKCYYFYPKEGYEKYALFLKNNQRPNVSKHELSQKLRESNILKLPASGTANTMKRTERGIYVYVIKRDALENY